MVICLEQGADLHMAQLMPLPLTVSCFSKIQLGFTFLVPAHLGSPGHRAVKRVCVWEGGMYNHNSSNQCCYCVISQVVLAATVQYRRWETLATRGRVLWTYSGIPAAVTGTGSVSTAKSMFMQSLSHRLGSSMQTTYQNFVRCV